MALPSHRTNDLWTVCDVLPALFSGLGSGRLVAALFSLAGARGDGCRNSSPAGRVYFAWAGGGCSLGRPPSRTNRGGSVSARRRRRRRDTAANLRGLLADQAEDGHG